MESSLIQINNFSEAFGCCEQMTIALQGPGLRSIEANVKDLFYTPWSALEGFDSCRKGLSLEVNKEKETFIHRKQSKVAYEVLESLHTCNEWGNSAIENVLDLSDLDTKLPSIDDLISILQRCRREGNATYSDHLHTYTCSVGLATHSAVGNHIVPMLVECGRLSNAQSVFDKLSQQNEYSWTSLLSGYAQCGRLQHALMLYKEMQDCCVQPSHYTLLAILGACASSKDLERGQIIHMEIMQEGLEDDDCLGSSLVDMYAKCGLLAEAQEVFDDLLVTNVVSWTALLDGYAEHGFVEKVLNCYEQMHQEGVSPNAVTFACILTACGSVGALEKGQGIHIQIAQRGLEGDLAVGNTLISMYTKCNAVMHAQEVFDKMCRRDVISWNALITGYVDHEVCLEVPLLLEKMKLDNVFPNAVTFGCMLKVSRGKEFTDTGRALHMEIMKNGLEEYSYIMKSLVGMYAKCGLFVEAQWLFDNIPVQDLVLWTTLIAGYAESGANTEALLCYKNMQLKGVFPDVVTFLSVVNACGSLRALDEGNEIYVEVVCEGFERDIGVGTALVGMYAKHGCVSEAREIFEQLSIRDALAWTTLIAGYAEHGRGEEALICFQQMQLESHYVDAGVLSCVLKACGSLGALSIGQKIHIEIAQNGFAEELSIGNMLINMYSKCGLLPEAQDIFNQLPVRDVLTWSSMIQAYGTNHAGSMVVHCFEDMQRQGVKPDAITFTCLLTACSHTGMVSEGLGYFKAMREKYEIEPLIEHYNCIVDVLARSGRLYEVENFVNTFCPFSVETWAALLSACKAYGEVDLGLRCFKQLVELKSEVAGWYVLIADVYINASRWSDAHRLEELRKHAGLKKKPASALIEVNQEVYNFVVGDAPSKELSAMLQTLNARIKEERLAQNVDVVERSFLKQKWPVSCEHAEKMAIAFGLLNTQVGETLRVTKNLRMCSDCHDTSKVISRFERREIILRDDCCVHRFKDGLCSCGDLF